MRRAGLWEMKVQKHDSGPEFITMQNCTDEATDRETNSTFATRSKEICPNKTKAVQKTATGYVVDFVCSGAGTPRTTHIEITGDYNSAYTMKTTSHREGGAANPPRDATITMEAKWLGSCKADQKPGDIWVGGFRLTIEDTKKRMKDLPLK